jgi:hypothetical protein
MWQYNNGSRTILALIFLLKEKLGGFANIDKNMLVSLKRLEISMLKPR